MKPRITLTAAPELNAQKFLPPAAASSRKRVVRPIEKKQKVNAQVLRLRIGTVRTGLTSLLYSAAP